ncbi:peroxiredoxin [Aureibaculum marinum]|uniref:thioredoxin-dependent peroxiredoxin n=1 Tax=Aureibaculum marinum TaxID=2487930 RepID=A0A3N4NVD7_9FLAO|nr:peroxiredoxin [Aureibaculum marinum]RPD98637.1 peroxiredoxin [Aureibaculum marinum]
MKIEVGSTVPRFSLKDQHNNTINIDDYIGKNAMVIYFYPKDDTPGCTKEACKFRDEYEAFTDLNVKVFGISADDVKSHKKFAEKYNLPFSLLADTDNKVRDLFGVPKSMLGLLPGRVTYVVDKKGIIIHIFNSQFGAEKHISEALSKLK